MLVRELAEHLAVRFEGDGAVNITGAAPLEGAAADQISFIGSRKAFDAAEKSTAGCLVAPHDFGNASGRTLLRAAQPRAIFAAAVHLLYPPAPVVAGIHPTASLAGSARVHPTAEIGPHVTVEPDADIGRSCRIGAGCYIGARSRVGAHSVLHPRVTLYGDVTVGERAILHSGCVLGADGFGFVLSGDHYEKFPQIGRVEIGDDVEIGANSCVDRAALGITAIGSGTKLDNMVHIGHNCRIGSHVVIAAQTGLSGGVVVEDYAVIGGQVGIGDKARIESRAVLGSGCGILTSKIVRGGQVVWGTPARPLKEHLEQLAALSRLPGVREEMADLKRRIDAMESGKA
jgi:UDP-3-O-[3-hydroxymyristoyl] glucosamine N-acyltransferase